MTFNEVFFASIVFVIFYSAIFYLLDKNKEPVKVLFRGFLAGIYSILLTGIIKVGLPFFNHSTDTVSGAFVVAFIDAGLIEEFSKSALFMALIYFRKEFDEWYDGILYGVLVGLGFGFFENIHYFLRDLAPDELHHLFWARSITSMPMHALLTGVFGYYAGKAKFLERQSNRLGTLLFGFATVVFFHGLYDFLLMARSLDIGWLSLFIIPAGWIYIFRLKKSSQSITSRFDYFKYRMRKEE